MKGKTLPPLYLSVAATAAHFGVSASSVYKGLGVFGNLRVVQLNGRRMILLADVEALDHTLEKQARPAKDRLRLVKRRRA
jgi:hypothetical protein